MLFTRRAERKESTLAWATTKFRLFENWNPLFVQVCRCKAFGSDIRRACGYCVFSFNFVAEFFVKLGNEALRAYCKLPTALPWLTSRNPTSDPAFGLFVQFLNVTWQRKTKNCLWDSLSSNSLLTSCVLLICKWQTAVLREEEVWFARQLNRLRYYFSLGLSSGQPRWLQWRQLWSATINESIFFNSWNNSDRTCPRSRPASNTSSSAASATNTTDIHCNALCYTWELALAGQFCTGHNRWREGNTVRNYWSFWMHITGTGQMLNISGWDWWKYGASTYWTVISKCTIWSKI